MVTYLVVVIYPPQINFKRFQVSIHHYKGNNSVNPSLYALLKAFSDIIPE
jgi:hypothetical protein